MFQQLKNIDTAFKYIRAFSMLLIVASISLSVYVTYKSYSFVEYTQGRIYILANGKALEAFSADRKDNIPVEAKDHIKTFHHFFFTLDPDDATIKTNILKALYLADGSAKKQYDNLRENSYYSNLIAGNVSQEVEFDSITIKTDKYPYYFKCNARQRIIRPTSLVVRSLVTDGYLRNVQRSDNNPHGFLIEKWNIIDNRDLKIENRGQ